MLDTAKQFFDDVHRKITPRCVNVNYSIKIAEFSIFIFITSLQFNVNSYEKIRISMTMIALIEQIDHSSSLWWLRMLLIVPLTTDSFTTST